MKLTIDGGSWGLKPGGLLSAYPYKGYADYRFYNVGFRLVEDVPGSSRVIRGGSWRYYADSRSFRFRHSPHLAYRDLGLRLVEDL